MKRALAAFSVLLCVGPAQARVETFVLREAVPNREPRVTTRVIRFDAGKRLFHVKDYFENGRIQRDAFYTSFDKRVKEEFQCNHRSNTREGLCTEWHRNGRKRIEARFTRGRRSGASTSWYESGQKEAEESWLDGQLHGRVRYWSEKGDLQFDSTFAHGMNQQRRRVRYRYLSYVPKGYEVDTERKWPLVIYLHGGSDRGTDLKKLYSSGIPDQVYRGRDFPFVMLAPQCPEHLRWSTDDWFESFIEEATTRYGIDVDRVYLTGPSLGGSGTWFLAARYPGTFAAIAPMSGFTSHLEYIDRNLDQLLDLPVWAFHGERDTVVPFEETERIVRRLEGRSSDLRFSAEPEAGHEIHWKVYPGRDLYDWLLRHVRRAHPPEESRRP
ncbi:MAG: prolyl oligopeptidase family serine peptidase [Holophagales bacterium]|nr:prolyl oligopeptidase family serine peptidase [Holophagales bacterium]MBK9964865.1 prolyl oligopeptidase family serine peptidase [Holophagales bacterium]